MIKGGNRDITALVSNKEKEKRKEKLEREKKYEPRHL
jgi:hypothetical protein